MSVVITGGSCGFISVGTTIQVESLINQESFEFLANHLTLAIYD
ncbi:MAG: hypothetical protein PUP92_07040 [Rhizonema sp. PD38]|nr:hypothetical protein [Rhizonema sp. PD38]